MKLRADKQSDMSYAKGLVQNWLRKLKAAPDPTPQVDMQQLVGSLGITRRRSVRVQMPHHQEAVFWPRLIYNNCRLRIFDLSVGGACLLDPEDQLGGSVGNEVDLELDWPEIFRERFRARLISCGHIRRNIQFLNLSTESQLRIHQFTKPALWGQRMRKSPDQSGSLSLSWVEMWTGMTGESLVFGKQAEVHLAFEQTEILIPPGSPAVYERHPKALKGRILMAEDNLKMLLLLANIDRPSPRVVELLERRSYE